jgi:hypothetical protein
LYHEEPVKSTEKYNEGKSRTASGFYQGRVLLGYTIMLFGILPDNLKSLFSSTDNSTRTSSIKRRRGSGTAVQTVYQGPQALAGTLLRVMRRNVTAIICTKNLKFMFSERRMLFFIDARPLYR